VAEKVDGLRVFWFTAAHLLGEDRVLARCIWRAGSFPELHLLMYLRPAESPAA